MKDIIAITLFALFINSSVHAQNYSIREECENAHYATGYVKLHQYKVTVEWSKISDHILTKLENILYGDNFNVVLERDINNNAQTIYHIKETDSGTFYDYEHDIYSLQELTQHKVECVYDL